jgi:hypothetical protein
MKITSTIAIILMLASSLNVVACSPAYGLDTIQMCPGYPKAIDEEMKKPHVCSLADKLTLWASRERERISNAASSDTSFMRGKLNQ